MYEEEIQDVREQLYTCSFTKTIKRGNVYLDIDEQIDPFEFTMSDLMAYRDLIELRFENFEPLKLVDRLISLLARYRIMQFKIDLLKDLNRHVFDLEF